MDWKVQLFYYLGLKAHLHVVAYYADDWRRCLESNVGSHAHIRYAHIEYICRVLLTFQKAWWVSFSRRLEAYCDFWCPISTLFFSRFAALNSTQSKAQRATSVLRDTKALQDLLSGPFLVHTHRQILPMPSQLNELGIALLRIVQRQVCAWAPPPCGNSTQLY